MTRSAFGVEDSRISKGTPLPGEQSPYWAAEEAKLPKLTPKQVRQRDRRGVAVLGATGAAAGIAPGQLLRRKVIDGRRLKRLPAGAIGAAVGGTALATGTAALLHQKKQ